MSAASMRNLTTKDPSGEGVKVTALVVLLCMFAYPGPRKPVTVSCPFQPGAPIYSWQQADMTYKVPTSPARALVLPSCQLHAILTTTLA